MTWTASLTTTEAGASGLVAAAGADDRLSGLAIDASDIAPDRWRVVVYLGDKPSVADRAALDRLAQAVLGPEAPPFEIAQRPDVDWVARSLEGLSPVRAGRFLIHGAHNRAAVRPNDLAIEIEAGQAFGTGHHGTTAGCLIAIDRVAKRRRIRSALDVGTGTGVLAIAIAKRCHVSVVAGDIDPVAVRIACENANKNGRGGLRTGARVTAVVASGVDAGPFKRCGPFDLIVANILAGPLVRLAPAIGRRLAKDGTLVLSGLLPNQRARIVATYRGQGMALAESRVLDGWLTLTLVRRRGVGRGQRCGIGAA